MNFKKRIENPFRHQVLKQDGYFIWCGSVIGDEKGKYHIFASRWEVEKTFSSWLTASRIVRAVSDRPEGPFTVVEELVSLNRQAWSQKMTHNPNVVKIHGKYYLFYTGTTYSDQDPAIPNKVKNHPARFNQQIGVAVADSPEGPWIPSPMNPILSPRPGEWDSTYVTNPSVFADESGEIRLIYKAKYATDNRLILGLAVAQHPEGPFQRKGPSPILPYDIEDPYIWREDGKYWMVAKDMTGEIVGKFEGILFESQDGFDWKVSHNALAWDLNITWNDSEPETVYRMERPQLLVENGKPICLYTAIMKEPGSMPYNLARKLNKVMVN